MKAGAATRSGRAPSAPVLPIVKWAGGKRRLVPQLSQLLPADWPRLRHVEPFAGGAALFLSLTPPRALLADVNEQLIETYRTVRDEVDAVIVRLRSLERAHNVAHYYALRACYNRQAFRTRAEGAAAFLYLNKTCFNGVYRVNRAGEFNVPIGRYAKPAIVDARGLRAASEALRAVQLQVGSFERTLAAVDRGDFVYLDPPYETTGAASFTGYAASRFARADHERLSALVFELDRRGVPVMLSNSNTAVVRDIYRGMVVREVRAARCVAARAASRQWVSELLIRNYE